MRCAAIPLAFPRYAAALCLPWVVVAGALPAASIAVVRAPAAGPRERLAARELRRYIYLRTGLLPAIVEAPPTGAQAIVVARKDRPLVAGMRAGAVLRAAVAALRPQEYLLRTVPRGDRRVVLVAGGDGAGTLYGAYRLAERLGVRFFLHGDAVPDERVAPSLPDVDETGRPLFELRGINPWGSHPFGIDLWDADDYLAHIHQLAKMRMNFIGIHCYPEGHPYAEPTVWIGLRGDFDERGNVTSSYPASYYNALFRTAWGGLRPGPTGAYGCGAAMLFDRDDWGADVMRARTPRAVTPADSNGLFNDTAAVLRTAFSFARLVGVKTCVGTETPLTLPRRVRERLRERGRDPRDPAVVQELYEGTFRRLLAAYPLDAYWLWTPESWTWQGNTAGDLDRVVNDIVAARTAARAIGAPFRLATSGWVLGPKDDRAAFDGRLPPDIAASALSRHLGEDSIDPAFARMKRRDTWAIPWLEGDNGGLAVPQLWVGRTRQDATDARAYRCTGLLGLLWRTRILGPNIAALAAAGWEQPWASDTAGARPPSPAGRARKVPCEDFYRDWARSLFGPEAAADIAAVFADIDSRLPRPLARGCPAGVRPDRRPWPEVSPAYAFVDRLAACRPRVLGAGNLARFDYWLGTMRYLRAGARLDCAVGALQAAFRRVRAASDDDTRARLAREVGLPAYRGVLDAYRQAFELLLATVSTKGGLATVMFWEHGFRPVALDAPARELRALLGAPLPEDARLPATWRGEPRLIVPTVRSAVAPGDTLRLRVIICAARPPSRVDLHWRPMGRGDFTTARFAHVARGVHKVEFPPGGAAADLEYYVEAAVDSRTLRFPATAPALCQTIVLLPRMAP